MKSARFYLITIILLFTGFAAGAQDDVGRQLLATGSLEDCKQSYPDLIVPETMCDVGGAVEWRVRIGGQIPWVPGNSIWLTPIGYCLRLDQQIWKHWARGWFDNRCRYTNGRPWTDWYPVKDPMIGDRELTPCLGYSNVVELPSDGETP